MKQNTAEPNGILLINKHAGATSHDIVNKIRRLYNTKKVGHAGTLDPMATGVLAVLIGRAAKASEYAHAEDKSYRAVLRLGFRSETEDIWGECKSTDEKIPPKEAVLDAIMSMKGKSKQIPPMYSAIKHNGKKLYQLAREGKEVEREARDIEVYSINAECLSFDEYSFDCSVSKGTYIRTLCTDIGKKLGCSAVMSSLMRTRVGAFDISDCHTVDEISELEYEQRLNLLLPTEQLFYDCEKVTLNDFFFKLCYSGCEIYQKKIGTNFALGQLVRLYSKDGFFGVGKVFEYEAGTAVKCDKIFVL